MMRILSRICGTVIVAAVSTVSAATETPRGQTVQVRNPDGSLYGTLRLNESGDALLLSWQGQERPFGECGDEIRGEATDGPVKAVVYERNCGATVDFATHVALRSSSRTEILAVFEGRPRVALKW